MDQMTDLAIAQQMKRLTNMVVTCFCLNVLSFTLIAWMLFERR